jgi:hypothetical protein
VSQRKGYGWSGEEATSGYPSVGASVQSITVASSSDGLLGLSEEGVALSDEVDDNVTAATPSVGGGLSSFESYR